MGWVHKMERLRRVLCLPDMHVRAKSGGHDGRSLKAVEGYMADHKWDEVIYIGDFMDFNCVSSHNIGNLRAVSGETIEADYEVGNEILDRHQKLCPKAKFTLIEGNHEFRIERYVDANPVMAGTLEVVYGLRLRQRRINWVRFWSRGEVYKLGKATFIHGIYTNEFHAKKHVQQYGRNVFYGHGHDVQCYSQIWMGDNDTIVGQSLGCLCDYRQSYIRGKPTRWQQAIGVFYFQPSGVFNYYVPMIFNHGFTSPEGKRYQG